MLTMMREATEQAEAKRDLVTWIKRNFFIPETKNDPILKGRIGLEQYQEDVLREILTPDENGNYKYSIVVWSDVKKSHKSSIAAAVNLARATFADWGEFYIVANDLKQAFSRVSMYIRRAIDLNPAMRKKYKSVGYRVEAPSRSFMESIPIDPGGEAGSNGDMVTFSELWAANQDAQQRMWTEMTIPPGKHGKAFRWVESYAGFLGESKLLYSLYELGVKQGELLWPDRLYAVTDGEPTQLELYVNRRAGMICLWNTQPRCPDQTKEYYASEEAILLPNEFLRVHRNQWVSATETFLPMAWYDACRRTEAEWPQINQKRHSMVIALDAGMTDDNFGLWMGCRHPEKPDEVVKIISKKWVPPKGGKIDFQGTPENPGPELMVRQLCRDYNVVWITYDEHQLYDMMNRIRKDGLAIVKRFPQGDDRLISDSQLRTVVRERRYWHRGEPDEREHFQNADAKIGADDDKIRIVKRSDDAKIDLCVCASMGVHTVLRLNL